MNRAEKDPSSLSRRIGWFTASCILVSNVVGTGIFTTTGFMARDLGYPGLILFIWLVGGLIALAGALSYCELGTAIPIVGGEYVYLRRAYGPFIGFLSGWTSFAVGFSAAIAAGAMSFAAYLNQLFVFDSDHGQRSTVSALILLWSMTAVHVAGRGRGGWLQRTLTVLNIGAILVLMTAGVMGGNGDWEHLGQPDTQATPSIGLSIVSLIFALYAYSGWNAAVYLAGEITEPARTIPRAMIGGTALVILLYLGLNLFYFYALSVTDLAQEPLLPVATKATVALLGTNAARFVTMLLCCLIIGAISAMIWAGPRVYYAMAKDGLIPAYFCRASATGEIPANTTVLQSLWASILILSGGFERVVIYSGTVLTLFSALAVGAVVILRRNEPDLPRPYRTPLYPFVPAFFILMSMVIIWNAVSERPWESGLGLATVVAGMPLYFIWQRFNLSRTA